MLVAGLAFVAHAAGRVGVVEIWAACRRAGPLVALVFLAPAVGLWLHAIGWRVLLPRDARPSALRSFRIFLGAQAGNEIGFGLLGEPLKVTHLGARHRDAAVAAVVLDNATAFVSLILFFITGLALSGGALPSPSPGSRAVALVLLVSVLALAWFLRPGKATALAGNCTRRPRWIFRAARMLDVCRRAAFDRPFDVLAATVFHYLGKLWIVAEFALLLHLLAPGTSDAAAFFGVASAAGSAVGAAVPGQLGVVEAAILGAASLRGIGASTALALALIRRARGWLWVLLGAAALPAMRR
ncbi:MAG TPA: lysylphosphatidylglycerol synthase domain-containing protein [Polyangiaceae bacterium]|nr:lysylphosphatidylglycerol synthase domain-containing protein [Polyangiaceae bacterium]